MSLSAGFLRVTVEYAQDIKNCEVFGRQDPYAVVKCGTQHFRTKTQTDAGTRPVWNEKFEFKLLDENAVTITLKDKGTLSHDDIIGSAEIDLATVRERGSDRQKAPVRNARGGKQYGFVSVVLEFEPSLPQRPSVQQPLVYIPVPVPAPPAGQPVPQPIEPSAQPAPKPAAQPVEPASQPAPKPNAQPVEPAVQPAPKPAAQPTPNKPAAQPAPKPAAQPMPEPAAQPAPKPADFKPAPTPALPTPTNAPTAKITAAEVPSKPTPAPPLVPYPRAEDLLHGKASSPSAPATPPPAAAAPARGSASASTQTSSGCPPAERNLLVTVVGANGIRDCDWHKLKRQDPYAIVKYQSHTVRTKVHRSGGSTPVWNESFMLRVLTGRSVQLDVELWDEDTFTPDDLIGNASISVDEQELLRAGAKQVQAPVVWRPSGQQQGTVSLRLMFIKDTAASEKK